MIEFYTEIRLVHIASVLLSGSLFFLRGVGVLLHAQWPMRLPVRLLSYSIDTVLLTAALMLFAMLPSAVFANGWLLAKLVLLIAYVVLGSYALKRANTRRVMLGCYVAALALYAYIASIARAHHPAGMLAGWLS